MTVLTIYLIVPIGIIYFLDKRVKVPHVREEIIGIKIGRSEENWIHVQMLRSRILGVQAK